MFGVTTEGAAAVVQDVIGVVTGEEFHVISMFTVIVYIFLKYLPTINRGSPGMFSPKFVNVLPILLLNDNLVQPRLGPVLAGVVLRPVLGDGPVDLVTAGAGVGAV